MPLRIASYNIRKCVGLDWRRDPERTLAVIRQLRADIVVLQEADKRLGARPSAVPPALVRRLGGLEPVAIGGPHAGMGFHGNAILAAHDLNVLRSGPVDLPRFEPRGAVLAEFSRGPMLLRVVGVHLGLLRRHRRQQLREIGALLDGLSPMPTVIAGDFNEWRLDDDALPLPAGYVMHTPGRTFHSARPVASLDRIVTGPGITLMRAGVLEEHGAARASDHLPIWAELKVAPEAARSEPAVLAAR